MAAYPSTRGTSNSAQLCTAEPRLRGEHLPGVARLWIKRRWRRVDSDCAAKTWTEHSEHVDAQVVLTRRCGVEAWRQVGENARPVSQLARELGVCWCRATNILTTAAVTGCCWGCASVTPTTTSSVTGLAKESPHSQPGESTDHDDPGLIPLGAVPAFGPQVLAICVAAANPLCPAATLGNCSGHVQSERLRATERLPDG